MKYCYFYGRNKKAKNSFKKKKKIWTQNGIPCKLTKMQIQLFLHSDDDIYIHKNLYFLKEIADICLQFPT